MNQISMRIWEMVSVNHNMSDTHSTPSLVFIGIKLAYLDEEDNEDLADKLSRLYSSRN